MTVEKHRALRIGIVAGEASGDLLAAGLIQSIKQRHPTAEFEGIAGPAMIAAGCKALFPAEKLAVMGLVEVLAHYRELHGIRNQVRDHFLKQPPDVFIGVDAPDFNLGLERLFKEAGIKTVHYVSPSVWAWRQYRVKKIAKSVDLILTLFPFEADFYRQHNVRVAFVGHPFADMIPLEADRVAARTKLGLPLDRPIVALLPGSRMSEVNALGKLLLDTASWIHQRQKDIVFVAPLATKATQSAFEEFANEFVTSGIDLRVQEGQARDVMEAADVVILASGTATLEALLLKRPMVVTYRLAPLTYWIAKRMIKTPYVSLPNLLAGELVVSELIQDQATADNLGQKTLELLRNPTDYDRIVGMFQRIHYQLRQNASERAATAVLELIEH
ncbi:MAG: lipid-A-disaccharide synthase [Gammaproteobacteria bacterium]|nr:lipid-A-disaccharide synthase [Gammaproteobacteria bacterium]